MSYTITVTRTMFETVKGVQDWKVIEKSESGHEVYGYTPEYEASRRIELDIFKQIVDELDMNVLILAINGLIPDQRIALRLGKSQRDYADALETEGEG